MVRRMVTELTTGPKSTQKTKSEFMAIDCICTDKQLSFKHTSELETSNNSIQMSQLQHSPFNTNSVQK